MEEQIIKEADKEANNLIDDANKSAERLEKANAEHKALLEREEKLFALRKLGGRSEAGQAPEIIKEETPREYANKLMNGLIALK